jgi:hypothetical protein
MTYRIILIFILAIVVPLGVNCQTATDSLSPKTSVEISRIKGKIMFDGEPGEDTWKAIEPLRLVMFSPLWGKEPGEETDLRIGYDDNYLYVGGRMNYKDTSMVRSASFKRDYLGMGSDWLGLILDTYNDKENAVAFFTTPDALRWDASIMRDAVTDMPDQMPFNISWNTFWDVKTTKNDHGWTAEIRIPLSSLRFQKKDGIVKMGLIAWRWMPSKNETDLFPAIPPNWGEASFLKPSQAREALLTDIKVVKPFNIAPYVLAGYSSRQDLNTSGTGYFKTNKPTFEAGGDIKLGLSGNMILDLTINTDFAQVEADDEQINLTRFSLYYPEKRPFFLERSSVFDLNLGANNTLFYSRRIGLSDDGDPIRIYGGARLIGRAGKWDVALLEMQTAPLSKKNSEGVSEDILPSENFGVLRFRRQVINENSYIGAGFTSRLGMNGHYNLGYGVDGVIRLFGQDYLSMRWAQTFETGVANGTILNPTRIATDWTRRSTKGLGYTFGYSYSGLNFNPGIGFEMIDNYSSERVNLLYGWLPGEHSKLFSHNLFVNSRYAAYLPEGTLMTFSNSVGWQFQTKNQWMGNFSFIFNNENLKDSLELISNELYVPQGDYKYFDFMSNLSTPGSNSFFLMMTNEMGQYFDGWRFSVRLTPTWNASKHFELGGTYGFDHVEFPDRDIKITNHIIGVRALYMLNTKLSVNAFVQYNTAENGIISNLRFRYNPAEGNDFYIVFNEGRNTNLNREIPHLPVYNGRVFMIKYSYTFRPRDGRTEQTERFAEQR